MFELNQLRCFVAVATEMNFRRAAQRLHMTQPPLSRQIQLLERVLGASLFDRTGRNVRLTAVGRMFLPEAQDLLTRADQAMLSALRMGNGEEGQIRFGFIPAAALALLPPLLGHLGEHVPKARLILNEMLTTEQIDALASCRIDLGVLGQSRGDRRITMQPIVRSPFVLVMHRHYQLHHGRIRELKDLDGENFLMYSPASGWDRHGMLDSLFNSFGIRPNYVQYAGQTHTILSMVNAGIGVAMVPAFAQAMGYRDLVFQPLDMPPGIHAELCLGWRNDLDEPLAINTRDAILDRFEVLN